MGIPANMNNNEKQNLKIFSFTGKRNDGCQFKLFKDI